MTKKVEPGITMSIVKATIASPSCWDRIFWFSWHFENQWPLILIGAKFFNNPSQFTENLRFLLLLKTKTNANSYDFRSRMQGSRATSTVVSAIQRRHRHQLHHIRKRSSAAAATTETITPEAEVTECAYAKPYSELPGPTPIPILGNTWRLLPVIGNYSIVECCFIVQSITRVASGCYPRNGLLDRVQSTAQHQDVPLANIQAEYTLDQV